MNAPPPLTELLSLDELQPDHYRARPSGTFSHRIYGGEVAAQAVVAAAETVGPERPVHSAHVHFVRPGNTTKPLDYLVERIRDSRSLSTRLVRTEQDGRTLALATVSFHVTATGPEHQVDTAPPPPPDQVPGRDDGLAQVAAQWPADQGPVPEVVRRPWPIDVRYIDRPPYAVNGPAEPSNRLWIKTHEALSDDHSVHAAALTFATDFPMFEPSLFPHGVSWLDVVSGQAWFGSSLDHTLFFHQPFRADDWLLMVQHNPITSGSRGMAEAKIYTRDGRLVASIVQECVMVPPNPVSGAS